MLCQIFYLILHSSILRSQMSIYINNVGIMNSKKISLLVLGWLTALCSTAQTDDHNFNVAKNMEIFTAVYKNLDMLYVDTLDANKVVGKGINAMLNSLDRYTEYYPEDETKDLKYQLTGKYAGIGSTIRYNFKTGYSYIDEPYLGMPAQIAGLKKGDMILAINDSTMKGKETAYVSDRLRGDAGTTFELKIKRPTTGKVMKFKITRKLIQTPAVSYYGLLNDSVGYIGLSSFSEGCSKVFRNAVIEMKHKGMKQLIFDLRNNGGGSEAEAVNIVNVFVPKGKLVVSNRGKLKRANRDFYTQVEPVDTVMPLVVLVNGQSASASEITSGALQDLDRAVVMGMRTYGKGIVQTMLELPYNTQMKLTTNKYYIPSGRCIQARKFRKTDGGAGEEMVADSLAKVFHTQNGRGVKDAGGIQPDIEVKPDSMPNITYYLVAMRDSSEVLLDYVVDYIAKHNTIASASDFSITDADFEDFKKRVVASNFKYDPISENTFADLVKVAKFEGYYDDAKQEFEALEKKLKHDVNKEMDKAKESIVQLLNREIVVAYYYQEGAARNSLRTDKFTSEALQLLANKDKYTKLLNATNKE